MPSKDTGAGKHEVVTPIHKTIRGEEKRFGPGYIITDELNQTEREEMYAAGALRAYRGKAEGEEAVQAEAAKAPEPEPTPAAEAKPA